MALHTEAGMSSRPLSYVWLFPRECEAHLTDFLREVCFFGVPCSPDRSISSMG
jgi:hypothetical protein